MPRTDPAVLALDPDWDAPDPDDDGGAGLHLWAGLAASLGRVATALESDYLRKQQLASKLRFAPIVPIVLTGAAGASLGTATFANAEIWGPKTGYFWAVCSIRTSGLADSQANSSLAASGAITAGAGAATLPALDDLTGFSFTLTTAGTVETVTVTNVVGGPLVYNFGALTAGAQTFPQGLQASGGVPTVTFSSTGGTAAGSIIAYGTSQGQPDDNVSIYRGPSGASGAVIQNQMNNLNAVETIWHPGRTEFILQPGDYITVQGVGLVSNQVSIGFDVIVGTLDILADFMM
ncbi:MAG TPA: hypothetical protein VKH61_17285 [Streptosporangiaceae bacterium]|nr:hypothetical protein [Streptosporangiaceae bacterium]